MALRIYRGFSVVPAKSPQTPEERPLRRNCPQVSKHSSAESQINVTDGSIVGGSTSGDKWAASSCKSWGARP